MDEPNEQNDSVEIIDSNEVHFLYELYINDIEFAKKSQWQSMVYFFALQGFVFQFIIDDLFSVFSSVFISFITYQVIAMYRNDIKKYQSRKKKLIKLFSLKVYEVIKSPVETNKHNMANKMITIIVFTEFLHLCQIFFPR